MTEVELIEQTALRVGMKSLMNHGAASCVYSEGCNGVTQEHLIAFAREVALHCVAALSQVEAQGAAQGGQGEDGVAKLARELWSISWQYRREEGIERMAARLRASMQAEPPVAPSGFVLVPVEPTEAMLDAGCDIDARGIAEKENLRRMPDLMPWSSAGQVLAIQYRAMIAAAPAAQQPTPPVAEQVEAGVGPKETVHRSCYTCKACQSDSYAVQGDSGHKVYCAHPSLAERKRIGDTTWDTPAWCPALATPSHAEPAKGAPVRIVGGYQPVAGGTPKPPPSSIDGTERRTMKGARERVAAFVAEYAKRRGVDPEQVYSLGTAGDALPLNLSDLRALLATPPVAQQVEAICYALRFSDDPRLNLSTIFDTEEEAKNYAEKCGGETEVVPLYTTPAQAGTYHEGVNIERLQQACRAFGMRTEESLEAFVSGSVFADHCNRLTSAVLKHVLTRHTPVVEDAEAFDVAMSRACVKAWDSSRYTSGKHDAVHGMYSSGFEAGYRAALSLQHGADRGQGEEQA